MRPAVSLTVVGILAGVAALGAVMVRAETPNPGPVLAKPRVEVEPTPPEEPALRPPPTLPDVDIPPIPEVDDDPFKPGLPPKRVGPSGLLAEGKRLFNREGRLEVDPIGRSIFVFDSGDKPVQLLENSWREFLESASDHGRKKARWRISGVVTVYGKCNYLLLTKCVRVEAEEENL